MKRIYVLSCDTLELENKTLGEMTVEEFKLFGKPYSINELVDGLNGYEPTFSIYHSWFRVIEEDDQPKLGLEPAYPTKYAFFNGSIIDCQIGQDTFQATGMSKRLLLAGMAMQGLLTNNEHITHDSSYPETTASLAFQYADELLKQE